MVSIQKLSHPDNVVLIPGATQNWPDLQVEAVHQTSLVRRIVDPHIPDDANVLAVGPHELDWLTGLARRTRLTVVTRGIPDAAVIAEALPDITVYCGDPARLPAGLGAFDVVVSLTDFARVLPLESDARPWASMYAELAALVGEGGRLIVGIENDLGLHRLAGPANPRSRNWDRDWAPLATWDETRPRTRRQVDALGTGSLWTLYPGWESPTVAHTGKLAPEAVAGRDAAVLAAAVVPLFGPDPIWYVSAATAADRVRDLAAGWIHIGGATDATQVLRTDHNGEVHEAPVAPGAEYRSLLGVIADQMAAHDQPGLRRTLSAWAAWLAESGEPSGLGTTLVGPDLALATIGGPGDGGRTAWQELAWLVAVIRGRGWRTPWPSPTSDDELLALLGAMAKLGELSPAELERLRVTVPPDPDSLRRLDRQELVALIQRNTEQINALRSRLNWTELQYVSSKMTRKAKAGVGKAKGVAKRGLRIARGGVRRVRGLLGR